MKDDLQNHVDLKLKRYDNIDGTGEMLMGLMLLGFALANYLNTILPDTRWWHGIGGVLVIYGVLIPVLAFGFWIRKIIKNRITWPRTGYAAFPCGGKAWWGGMAKVSVIAVVVSVGGVFLLVSVKRHGGMNFFQIGYWALFVVGYAFWVFRMGGREYTWKWFVWLFMAVGLLALLLIMPGDFFQRWWVVASFIGFVWFGSGAGTLYSYVRHTKPATPATE